MAFLVEGQGEGELVLEIRLLVDQGLVERILDKLKDELKRLPGTTARAFPSCAPQVNYRLLKPSWNADTNVGIESGDCNDGFSNLSLTDPV